MIDHTIVHFEIPANDAGEHAKSVEAADEFRFEGRNFGPRMFAPSAPMKKTSDSIWIYKTKPLLPRIYRYFFIVDGIPTKER